MKFLLINNIFPPEGTGGAERFVEKQADELVKEGHEVVVVAGSRGRTREFYRNYRIIRFRPWNIYFLADAPRYYSVVRFVWTVFDVFNILAYVQLKKIIKRERPDTVITHNLKGLGFLTFDLLRILRIKQVHYVHDVQLTVPSGILYRNIRTWHSDGILKKLYALLLKRLAGSPSEVISLSNWLLLYYKKQGFFKKSKTSVLQFEIGDDAQATVRKKLAYLLKKLNSSKDVHILYVGKIEEHKGILPLVKHWNTYNKNLHLTIIGGGERVRELKIEIQHQHTIAFLGEKTHSELREYYKNADALIFPTLCFENRPQVIVEALTSGLPVIASPLGGIPEIIEDGTTGILFEPDETGFSNVFKRTALHGRY